MGRGKEYCDSWATENIVRVFTDFAGRITGGDDSNEAVRLRQLAALCDVKLSRLGGAFKDDTWHDGCNYQLVMCALARLYLQGDRSREGPSTEAPVSMPAAWYNDAGVPEDRPHFVGPL